MVEAERRRATRLAPDWELKLARLPFQLFQVKTGSQLVE